MCTGEFLWKSFSQQQNFVAATSRTNLVWFAKFCCGHKTFHNNSPVLYDLSDSSDLKFHRQEQEQLNVQIDIDESLMREREERIRQIEVSLLHSLKIETLLPG